MIIVNIMGGLGNQMFQYAAAKHLSIINHTTLKIDASNFRKLTLNKEHIFQLDCFNITAQQALKDEIGKYKTTKSRLGNVFELIKRTWTPNASHGKLDLLYEEPDGSEFRHSFFELGPDKYLIGYFNSYKYFTQIENTNSISVHIRRGDYVDDPNVRKGVEGIITDGYYRKAIESLSDRVVNPQFFIFSNDMGWVKDNFKIPFKVTYVDINSPQRGFEDLWVMSRCKHNITAGGSTFSWWAAYLNQNPDKIVVRTEKISNDLKYNHPEDYFPQEWETVKS
jgi:hypothetical protein